MAFSCSPSRQILFVVSFAVTNASSTSNFSSYCDQKRTPNANVPPARDFQLVGEQLKKGLSGDSLRPQGVKAGKNITVHYLKNSDGLFYEKGLPIARVAKIEISAPVQKVVEMFMDNKNRSEWDATCSVSQIAISKTTGENVNYILNKSSALSPARDFAFVSIELPSAIVGINNFNAKVVVSRDAANEVPRRGVRAQVNSIMVMEPVGLYKTLVTYVVEASPGGWISYFPSLANLLAGNALVMFLDGLKGSLEESDATESMSIEDAARTRFNRNLTRASRTTSIVDDVGVTKADLRSTVALLERKLAELRRVESADKIDLSELRDRVSKDLQKARERLDHD